MILRHGGEAQSARDAFAKLGDGKRARLLAFLGSLVLFSPEDTASNLSPAVPSNPNFPIDGHGAIALTPQFNDPIDVE